MNAFPWLRLYNETLSDRKIARICRDAGQPKALVIGVWATLLMLASESPRRGELLISDDLPLSPDEIRDETGLDDDTFSAIVTGLSSYSLIDTSGPVWTICNWDKRQPSSDNSAERVRQHRERQRNVTPPLLPNDSAPLQKRYSNVLDKDKDKEGEEEGEKSARAGRGEAQRQPATVPPPFSVVVDYIPDRTPGGNGYHPPAEPPEPEPDPAAEDRRQAIGHMANAITDVTGISAKLNKAEVIPLAIELVDAGYSPGQLHRHYGKDATPGGWNWYKDDWRGQTTEKRKGSPPRLREIRETIVLATSSVETKTGKKLGAIERALAMFGPAPNVATTG